VSSEEEKNMALVRSFWKAVANADLDALDELLALTSSIMACLPAKSLAVRATSSRWMSNTLPSLKFDALSRTR
jgi:ketosteroid isomerase-like protein